MNFSFNPQEMKGGRGGEISAALETAGEGVLKKKEGGKV